MNIITCIDFSNNVMTGTMMKRFETQLCFVLVCFILNILRCNIVNGFCFVHYFKIAFYIIFLFFYDFLMIRILYLGILLGSVNILLCIYSVIVIKTVKYVHESCST